MKNVGINNKVLSMSYAGHLEKLNKTTDYYGIDYYQLPNGVFEVWSRYPWASEKRRCFHMKKERNGWLVSPVQNLTHHFKDAHVPEKDMHLAFTKYRVECYHGRHQEKEKLAT